MKPRFLATLRSLWKSSIPVEVPFDNSETALSFAKTLINPQAEGRWVTISDEQENKLVYTYILGKVIDWR